MRFGHRIRCPAHGGSGLNCSVWTDERGRLHAKCWSHGCRESEIVRALGKEPDLKLHPHRDPNHSRAIAFQLWNQSRNASGTIVHRYLKARGISLEPQDRLRYHPALRHPSGIYLPAMVAVVDNADGQFLGIHRTWLHADRNDKAAVDPQKAALGAISGGAVRLTSNLSSVLALSEGIETGLSVLQATSLDVWAVLGTSGLRSVRVPDVVRRVIIFADRDWPGLSAASAARRRLTETGRQVQIVVPRMGDFNDVLNLK